MPLSALRRVRWAVRATLTLGVAASVATNVLHARPNPISQAIAAWPPLALLLAVELISRVPMYRRYLAAARLAATAGIAGIAAWVSYWHMAGVASRYGESHTSAYLLPLSVDGLIVVASVSLVELAGRIRVVEQELADARGPAGTIPVAAGTIPMAVPGTPKSGTGTGRTVGKVPARATSDRTGGTKRRGRVPAHVFTSPDAARSTAAAAGTAAAAAATAASGAAGRSTTEPTEPVAIPAQRRSSTEIATLASATEAVYPGITQAELARQLGISVYRLRQVKREMREPAET